VKVRQGLWGGLLLCQNGGQTLSRLFRQPEDKLSSQIAGGAKRRYHPGIRYPGAQLRGTPVFHINNRDYQLLLNQATQRPGHLLNRI